MRASPAILGCLSVATMCPAQTPYWTQIKPTSSPSARVHGAMAYDAARQRTVFFGGFDGSGFPADTWEWDGKAWSQVNPTASPSGRINSAVAYDAVRQRTVLFGGYRHTPSFTYFSETWEWDGITWTQIKPTAFPSARSGPAMAYDSVRRRMVLFGGYKLPTGVLADTWEWDGKVWTQITPTSSPPARSNHTMVYDSARQRTVLFGGYDGRGNLMDTWEWTGKAWTQITPTLYRPTTRVYHAMAYGSARQRTVLFGGEAVFGRFGDTWEWDGRTWSPINPVPSPPGRSGHAMAYDSARQRTVLFGGSSGSGQFADTWEYGLSSLTLTANTPTIPTNGGTQVLTLNAGADLQNKSYWIFGSATSTMPGIVLTGIHIPLRPDIYTDLGLNFVNSKEFTNFRGTLSATGTATASLNVAANLPIPKGFKLYHAYVVYDGATGQVFTSSNPVSVEFR